MILSNERTKQNISLSPLQAQLFQFMQDQTERARSLENALGYFEFTVKAYQENHKGTQTYLSTAINKLIDFGAIQYIRRGNCPSYVKVNQGIKIVEVGNVND